MKIIYIIILLSITYNSIAQETDWSKIDWKKPESSEFWDVKPKFVTPATTIGNAPSDAKILFDGKNMDNWMMMKDKSPSKWKLGNGTMTIVKESGDLATKEKFGNCQFHIEFMIPSNSKNEAYYGNAGNSGIFLQERYELQIFDSYKDEVPLYSNGQCGSIYKQAIPMVNACSKPGEWNSFDVMYTAPVFRQNGTVEKPAYITVLHNGIFILNHFEIQGTIEYIGIPRYEPHGKSSIVIQGHGSEVSFRNIWIREL
jgi:Domain of Unknown Function (DUF1080)